MTSNESADIAGLGELVQRLRRADVRLRVFGAETHRYRLGPKLMESTLVAFEAAIGARLPEEYRRFLAEVGDGGAGPYYGLLPLGSEESLAACTPSAAFPLGDDRESVDMDEVDLPGSRHPGVLAISHIGCGNYEYLVVDGPTRGSIWHGGDGSSGTFDRTGLGFDAWYRQWAERTLREVASERPSAP